MAIRAASQCNYLLTAPLFATHVFPFSWGESAGSISVALQMLMNGGDPEGLFHGAFMGSGSPIPAGSILHGQRYYDAIVDETGCSGQADTLQCLREVPYDTLKKAVDNSPSILSYQVSDDDGPKEDS